MNKPREFWLNGEIIYHTEEDGRYFQNALLIETIHVIEKFAADKLAEAIESGSYPLAKQAAAEYRRY